MQFQLYLVAGQIAIEFKNWIQFQTKKFQFFDHFQTIRHLEFILNFNEIQQLNETIEWLIQL